MDRMKKMTLMSAVTLVLAIWLAAPAPSLAHCDGLDGPVVTAARKALETGDIRLVLAWVKISDEGEIRAAFEKTLAVRKVNPQARELADLYFFETLVRIHRAGEGAPYTGLKSAGRDLGAAIPAGDKAIASGSAADLTAFLTDRVRHGLEARFRKALAASRYSRDDVEAGRKYVKAYVEYIHYVEQLYETAGGSASEHGHEATPGGRSDR